MASLLVAVGMAAACSGGGAASGVGSPTGGSAGADGNESFGGSSPASGGSGNDAGGSPGTGGANTGEGGSAGSPGDGGSAGSSGGDTECEPDTVVCDGDATRACGEDGKWQAPVPCDEPTPTCFEAACISTPPSCLGLAATCGANGADLCCVSLPVIGGSFNRINDADYPATISDFRLDKYEVSVGRFRKFVEAWNGGFRPAEGAGKHVHLDGGDGLTNSHSDSNHELGWDEDWADDVDLTDENLTCDATFATWTNTPGSNESRPMTCANWYEAYAFCIWDGGFLPSEAEWNYAAAGGDEQRFYPWSSPPASAVIDCSYASYSACDGVDGTGVERLTVVGSKPNGDGRYGHSDLAGNVREWNLDWHAAASTALSGACNDCAYLPSAATHRASRGGAYWQSSALVTSERGGTVPGSPRQFDLGFRCARAPELED